MALSLTDDAVRRPRQKLEFHIEQTCSEFLSLDGWRAIITDPPQLRGLGVSEKGIPDRLYIRYTTHSSPRCDCVKPHNCPGAEVLWIEWKSPRGTPSVKQLDWHAAERARGALTLIAGRDFERSIEGFQSWYRQSGLMRRRIR